MEMAEAMDSFTREKYSVDRDERKAKSSRLGSSSLLWQWIQPPSAPKDPGRRDESRARRVSPLYLIGLTVSTGGLQIIWTAIMSQGSPYLSSLGLPSYLISLIWLAGPLSGTLVQPCIGVLSDRCQHRWGRRRPFIIFGTLATVVCLLALPRTADVIALLSSSLSHGIDGKVTLILTRVVATAWIWALNIAIQPVQAGIRALIVDCCPPGQQAQANAYAGCIISLGTVLGYASGFVSLPDVLPWLGDTQFKGLCVVASLVLSLTVTVTCLVVMEETAVINDKIAKSRSGVFAVFGQILSTAETMPRKIKRVCIVQFFAWIGWFPFLFFATTYVGNLYQDQAEALSLTTHPGLFQTPIVYRPDSARQGTSAMTLFAIVAFFTSLFLPLFVSHHRNHLATSISRSESFLTTSDLEAIENDESVPGSQIGAGVLGTTNGLPQLNSIPSISWLTLPRTWTASHIMTSVVLLSTALTDSRNLSVLLVGLLGISWAMTQWIPFTLISAEMAKEISPPRIPTTCDLDGDREQEDAQGGSFGLRAGTIMGVHNMAIATPQIVAAVGSSALFWALGRWDVDGEEAVGWVMRLGGLAGFVAAWVAAGIEDN